MKNIVDPLKGTNALGTVSKLSRESKEQTWEMEFISFNSQWPQHKALIFDDTAICMDYITLGLPVMRQSLNVKVEK